MIFPFHTRLLSALALAALATQAGSAVAADAAQPLEPSTPWKIDYAKDECRLLRTFGTGDDAITLRLARGSGMQSFDMVIAGTKLPPMSGKVKVTMTLEPQNIAHSFDGYAMSLPKRPERLIRWFDGNPEIMSGITDTQRIRLASGDRIDIIMQWTNGRAALEALHACHTDLLKSWGVDVDAMRGVKAPPEPLGTAARWATTDDYPAAAMRDKQEGDITFQLGISAAGAVENCTILHSSNVAALDETTCRLMRARARFSPALDANDRPTASIYISRVRWQIPN